MCIRDRKWPVMLDSGSSVNSIPEDVLVQILNHHREAGIALSDKKHPIKALEKWSKPEEIRGVAGNAPVPLLGGVVMEFRFSDCKSLLATGPTLKIRFKIAKSGATDEWCPIIIGARALECTERNGLRFMPGANCHYLTTIGVQAERYEGFCKPVTNGIHAMRAAMISHTVFQARSSVLDTGSAETLPYKGFSGLYYDGEPFMLGPDEGAMIPAVSYTHLTQPTIYSV